jgi:hypothetical protein
MWVMLTPAFTSRPVPAQRNPAIMSWMPAAILLWGGSLRGGSPTAVGVVVSVPIVLM